MGMKTMEKLKAIPGHYHLPIYEEAAANHNWEETEKAFSWHKTGLVNMAYEAIDRHTETARKNKIALYYTDGKRKEAYSFNEMKRLTNKAANVFKSATNLKKGDRLFIFMPRSPELYFSLLGALKMGVIVGPLFEAFMEGAVYDRLSDSDAKVLVTTPELLGRVPLDKLPNLQHVFLIGLI
ncbi:acetate--CoA ligase OS=Lysinibacillus sphaericus OX=1421 GN=LS41612_06225 PE=4 SV=1 [Lysinibacillus sphaericus]